MFWAGLSRYQGCGALPGRVVAGDLQGGQMSAKDNPAVALPTLEALRRHVLETLCAHDQLDPGQTPFFQSLVTRSEQVCGLFFQVQGPRQVRNYAVWAGE